jgi:FixJ family two-component response regulator
MAVFDAEESDLHHHGYRVTSNPVQELSRRQMMVLVPSVLEAAKAHDDVLSHSPTVFVIDPDPDTGQLVKDLLHGHKVNVELSASGREFFATYRDNRSGCLVLGQRIVDISGLQIQRRLAEQERRLPMIYVTSGIDISTAVALMRGGAIHVLEKPLRPFDLLDAIGEALEADRNERRKEAQMRQMRESISMLTMKERQLVSLAAAALPTKAIALKLNISPRAVELRCRGVKNKLGLKSGPEFMRFALIARQEFSHHFGSAMSGGLTDC